MTDQSSIATSEADRAANLAAARVAIDSVDDEIHRLLIRRAELVQQVAATKRLPDGSLPRGAYRPGREASIHRRLFAQNKPPLPFGTVFRLWREMIGTFTAIQSPVIVSLHAGSQETPGKGLIRIAREHFGTAAEINLLDNSGAVASDVISAPGTVGVVPVDSAEDWWTGCLKDATAPKVIAAIPCFGKAISGYCLSLSAPENSGDDVTLIAARLSQPADQSAIDKALNDGGLDGQTCATSGATALIRLSGFHIDATRDTRARLAAALGVDPKDTATVGAYPVPIIEENA